MTRIIGIDPGSRHTGYGIIEAQRGRAVLVTAGRISTERGEMPQRLLQISQELGAVLAEFRPDEAAVEQVFVNKNVQSALTLGQARGVALCALAQAGLLIAEYTPASVKQAVTGSGRADKQQVQQMVKILLKLQGTLATDASDALAVALTHAQSRSTPRATALAALGVGRRRSSLRWSST